MLIAFRTRKNLTVANMDYSIFTDNNTIQGETHDQALLLSGTAPVWRPTFYSKNLA